MGKQRNQLLSPLGFTLIELLFSVAIASLILMGVFSFFSDSIWGVVHSEDTLKTVEEIGKLTRQLRHDLSGIRPFQGPSGESIDLYRKPQNFPLYERSYRSRVFQTNIGSSHEIQVSQTLKKFRKIEKDGRLQYESTRHLDTWFKNKSIHGGSHLDSLEDAFVSFPVKLRKHPGIKIRDHYLFSGGRKILYRHFGEPLNFLGVYEMDASGNPVEIMNFGKDKQGQGRIPGFLIEPIFEFASYPTHSFPQKRWDFLRYFLKVELEFQGKLSSTGPNSRRIEIKFRVMNPFLNGQKFVRGGVKI
jgi:prepilin-type N-terminal cleavage/methylation domain-containing protein